MKQKPGKSPKRKLPEKSGLEKAAGWRSAGGDRANSVEAKEAEQASGDKLPVVGIGASAGGLEAFTQLLRALPSDTGMAFVFVQHLEAKHESMLTRLLASATRMPVTEVKQGTPVQPNHVYVIPANADLSISKGTLTLAVRTALAGRHMPIDNFFGSLAEERGTRAIGVILSGTASDGTLGLKAIKVEGGITFAQEPESAKFDGMPRNAISAGCIDFILPPEGIARELAQISRHPYVAWSRLEEAPPLLLAEEEEWARIFRLLRTASGVDFTYYKKSTIKRRVSRRMALHKIEHVSAYIKHLESDRGELDALYQDILIHVTSFFREPDVFRALQSTIIPQIAAGKPAGEPIRIWVSGCSTGEEVYSIAICALENSGNQGAATPIQMFGSDISEQAIEKARSGIYSEEVLAHVSQERLRRFFARVDGHYQINSNIRDLCVFARHDLTKDPPFSRLDLVSCRNVLIYLEPVLQKKVLASFHYALRDTGFLLLGKSETLGGFPDLFTIVDRKNKFFIRKATAAVPVYETGPAAYQRMAPREKRDGEETHAFDLEKEADRVIWDRYAHAGLVINDEFQILHFRGDTSPYVRPAPGKATFNVLRMLREELAFELRAEIQKARNSGNVIRREAIRLKYGGQSRHVSMEVRPLVSSADRQRYFLVLFEEEAAAASTELKRAAGRQGKKAEHQETQKLRDELARTRERLQAIIQEEEATNEELKSANEEALSNMEELQSANEELETAKEELQSSNEELVTLNEQLQNRNAELAQSSDDLNNVLSGANVPILLLGRDQRIRRFTPPAEKLLHLLPGDVGRPIRNIRLGLNIPDLDESIAVAIDKGNELQREVRAEDGRWYSARVRPYRTRANTIDGALITFVDIHELRQEKEATMRALMETAAQAILAVGSDGRIVLANAAVEKMFGYSREEILGQPVENLMPVRFRKQHAAHRGGYFLEPRNRPMGIGLDLAGLRKDGSEFPVEVSLSHIETRDGVLSVSFVSDITERKRNSAILLQYQQDLQALTARLLHAREEETKHLARELHDVFSQKLAALAMEASSLLQAPDSSEPLRARLRLLGQEVRVLADDIHSMSRRLHPAILDDLGLDAALKDECAIFSSNSGIPVEFRSENVPAAVPEDVSLCLYRVAQESLRNIGKHARAKEVDVLLAGKDSGLTLRIEDLGNGFDLEEARGKGGLGLISMEERVRLVNGNFAIRSEPGQGTTVEVRVPVNRKTP